jgi:hypothetical protein
MFLSVIDLTHLAQRCAEEGMIVINLYCLLCPRQAVLAQNYYQLLVKLVY